MNDDDNEPALIHISEPQTPAQIDGPYSDPGATMQEEEHTNAAMPDASSGAHGICSNAKFKRALAFIVVMAMVLVTIFVVSPIITNFIENTKSSSEPVKEINFTQHDSSVLEQWPFPLPQPEPIMLSATNGAPKDAPEIDWGNLNDAINKLREGGNEAEALTDMFLFSNPVFSVLSPEATTVLKAVNILANLGWSLFGSNIGNSKDKSLQNFLVQIVEELDEMLDDKTVENYCAAVQGALIPLGTDSVLVLKRIKDNGYKKDVSNETLKIVSNIYDKWDHARGIITGKLQPVVNIISGGMRDKDINVVNKNVIRFNLLIQVIQYSEATLQIAEGIIGNKDDYGKYVSSTAAIMREAAQIDLLRLLSNFQYLY
eukprot:503805_1